MNTRERPRASAAAAPIAAVLLVISGWVPGIALAQTPDPYVAFLEQQQQPTPNQPAEAQAAAYLAELYPASRVPGLSVAVAQNGAMVFSSALGFADVENAVPASPATVFNIGSVSKVLTAVAVMQLVERGSLKLEDRVRRYVPELPDRYDGITIWHLMTHTSGIRHYRAHDFPEGTQWDNVGTYDSFEEALELFASDPLLFEPGTYFHYTSYGVNLLGGVVERASRMPFEDFMQAEVYQPAGMLSTCFDRPGRIVFNRARGHELEDGSMRLYYPNENMSYKFASGGMLSTAEDLVRFGVALLGGRLLGSEAVRDMLTPEPELDGIEVFHEKGPPTAMRWKQGLLWRIRQDPDGRSYVHHCGSIKGFNACLLLYPDEGLVAASADNANRLGTWPSQALADIFRVAGTHR